MLYSEQEPQQLAMAASQGKVAPLPPMTSASPELFRSCERIVALMGPEPYAAAIEAGADIVLGGCTTDTAVLAPVPLMRGAGAGAAWHAGKVAECGELCTARPREGGVLIRVDHSSFDIEPLRTGKRCTPHTVSAHMPYENSNPFMLHEPGGTLDVTQASYTALDDSSERVTGSVFDVKPYTMKLEGAASGGWQTLMLVGIQDRRVLGDIDGFLDKMHGVLTQRVRSAMGNVAGDFHISLRPYGWNAVSGLPVTANIPPLLEIGLMIVATAGTQELATQIANTCNPWFFHLPVDEDQELPSYGFPFSPAELERGQFFEFKLNHVVSVAHPLELVRTELVQVEEAAHA